MKPTTYRVLARALGVSVAVTHRSVVSGRLSKTVRRVGRRLVAADIDEVRREFEAGAGRPAPARAPRAPLSARDSEDLIFEALEYALSRAPGDAAVLERVEGETVFDPSLLLRLLRKDRQDRGAARGDGA